MCARVNLIFIVLLLIFCEKNHRNETSNRWNDFFSVSNRIELCMSICEWAQNDDLFYSMISYKHTKTLSFSLHMGVHLFLSIDYAWFVCLRARFSKSYLLNRNARACVCVFMNVIICWFVAIYQSIGALQTMRKIELIQWSETSVLIQLYTNYNQSLFTWRAHTNCVRFFCSLLPWLGFDEIG